MVGPVPVGPGPGVSQPDIGRIGSAEQDQFATGLIKSETEAAAGGGDIFGDRRWRTSCDKEGAQHDHKQVFHESFGTGRGMVKYGRIVTAVANRPHDSASKQGRSVSGWVRRFAATK